MSLETWNENKVMAGTDLWNLVKDVHALANQNNRVIPVASKTARNRLVDDAPGGVIPNGTVVLRTDQSTAGAVYDVFVGGVWVEGDTGWVNFSFASGFKQQGTQPNRWRQVGREVKIEVGFTQSNNELAKGDTLVPFSSTLPTGGPRPLGARKYFMARTNSLDRPASVYVDTDGLVKADIGDTGTTKYIAGVFAWFSE